MSLLVQTLQARGAKSVKSCVFLNKPYFLYCHSIRVYLTIYIALSHPPGDQLIVLTTKIQYNMSLLVQTLQARGAKSVKSCVFLNKPARHSVAYRPDYVGYEIPDAFVIGYGLDYNEQYRQLPYVGII